MPRYRIEGTAAGNTGPFVVYAPTPEVAHQRAQEAGIAVTAVVDEEAGPDAPALQFKSEPLPGPSDAGTPRSRHRRGRWAILVMVAFAAAGAGFVYWQSQHQERATIRAGTQQVISLSFKKDGQTLVVTDQYGEATFWNVASGQRERTFSPKMIVYSPSLGSLVRFRPDAGAEVINNDGVAERQLLPPGSVTPGEWCRISADGRTLIWGTPWGGSVGGRVQVWTVGLQDRDGVLRVGAASPAVLSPDGKAFAARPQSKMEQIALWTVPDDERVGMLNRAENKGFISAPPDTTLTGHTATVWSIEFSPNGKLLASAGDDRSIRLWDLGKKAELGQLLGHALGVKALAFSPDGNVLASGSNDETVKFWSLPSGKELATRRGQGSTVMSLAFSPDGRTLASGGFDGAIKLWDVPAVE